MFNAITCKCGTSFEIEPEDIQIVVRDDLQARYIQCPGCQEKYLIIATDTAMRELIKQRARVRGDIFIARQKHFRGKTKTIEAYIRKDQELKEQQERMHADLVARGRELLREI